MSTVTNMLSHAQAVAADVADQNRASAERMIQLDLETRTLCKKLVFMPIEPDQRIVMAKRLVELQTERKAIVQATIKRNAA